MTLTTNTQKLLFLHFDINFMYFDARKRNAIYEKLKYSLCILYPIAFNGTKVNEHI